MKKILIAVLAAAVLFGFAACEDGSSSATSGVIGGVTVKAGSEKVYIPGETVDLNDYTFTLTMEDGSTKPADAADFVVVTGNTLVVPFKNTDKYAPYVAYKGMSVASVALPVNVGTVTAIELSGEAEVGSYYATSTTDAKYRDDLINLKGLTVTAKYTDENKVKGEKEIAIENKYLHATIGSTVWESAAEDQIVTVYFDEGTVKTISDTYTVDIKKNLVTGIEFKATEGYQVVVGSAVDGYKLGAAASTAGKLDDGAKGVYVEATFQNGETAVIDGTDVTVNGDIITLAYTDADDQDVDFSSFTAPTKAGKLELTVTCGALDAVAGVEPKKTIEIAIVENKEVKLSVSAESTFTPKDYTRDEENAFNANFIVKAIKVDGTEGVILDPSEFTVTSPAKDARNFSTKAAGELVYLTVKDNRSGSEIPAWTGSVELQ